MVKEKLITIPLKRFVYYSIGLKDNIEIDIADATHIQKVDPERSFVHVQFNDLENGKKLKKPILWSINDWNTNYEVHKARKRNAEERRIRWDITNNNLNKVAARCRQLWGIDEEPSKEMAAIIIKQGEPALNVIGTKIATFHESMLTK